MGFVKKKKSRIVINEFVIGFIHMELNTWQKSMYHYRRRGQQSL